MYESTQIDLTGYTPVGDIIVISFCMIMAILLWQTHINKNTKFRSIMLILLVTWIASVTNVVYEMLMYSKHVIPWLIYVTRTVHHVTLTFIPCMYIQYLHNPLWIPNKEKRRYGIICGLVITAVSAFDILGIIFHFGFYIDSKNNIHKNFNPYIILYIFSLAAIFYIIVKYKARVIR